MSEAVVEAQDLAQVIDRCRARDEGAWRELYEANFEFVYRTARRLGTPEEEAEDVAHEVFVVVLRKLDQFVEGRLTTWLYRITANVVSAKHRRRRVRRAFEKLGVWPGASPLDSPHRHVEKRGAACDVERVMERMSPKKREVFALYELEGLSGEEIAERIACPLNTVWTRLHHARRDFVKIGRRLGCIEETAP